MKLTRSQAKTLDKLDRYNQEQVKELRGEASSVITCFTEFFYKTMAICFALAGIVAYQVKTGHDINYTLLFVTSVCIYGLCWITGAIGTHKYNTANRIHGYIIHLSRTSDCMDWDRNTQPDRQQLGIDVRKLNWEEVMFAWRVVQPVIYGLVYGHYGYWGLRHTPKPIEPYKGKPNGFIVRMLYKFYKFNIRNPNVAGFNEAYPWYDSKYLLKGEGFVEEYERQAEIELTPQDKINMKTHSNFYPGKYFRRLENALLLVSIMGILGMGVSAYHLWGDANAIGVIILIVIITLFLWGNIRDRVNELEHGLLSIQTCAFVWRMVSLVHLLALKRISERNSGSLYQSFTWELSKIATTELAPSIKNPHTWIDNTKKELRMNKIII